MRRETDAARTTNDVEGESLLGRRPYLKLAGAAVGALALGSTSASAADSSVIVVDGRGVTEKTNYTIEVTDTIERIDTSFADTQSDSLSGGKVEGSVVGGADAYRFTGTISAFEFQGPAKVSYNTSLESIAPELAQDVIEIVSDDSVTYTFTTSGKITKLFDNGKNSAEESNDTVSQNDDGTWTASGFTGNGYGDGYTFDGELVDFSPNLGNFRVLLNGEEISPKEYGTPTTKLEVTTASNPSEVSYEFTTTGRVTKLLNNGENSAEGSNDTVSQNDDGTWTASGFTGNGYGDGFEFDGELKAFSPNTGDFKLLLDGQEVSPEDYGDVPKQDPPVSSDSLIGGGDGYANVVPKSEATTVVSSFREFRNALNDASSGDVVYVDGGANINMRESRLTVPSGVTLASNRGIGGAKGGRIYTDGHPWKMLTLESNVRVTGLRIAGPRWDWVDETETTELGLNVEGSGVEIDNIEGYGWGYAVVRTDDDTHVHHCHLHHCSRMGHGYGVATEGSDYPIIEYNLFAHNRHSVQGNGGGYEIRYNIVDGPAISHAFDQHRPGGTTMKIHHNTVRPIEDAGGRSGKGDRVPAVAIRGTPSDIADIYSNWFHNDKQPRSRPDDWTDEAIIQVHTSRWDNVEYRDNHYGSDEPSADIGHPR